MSKAHPTRVEKNYPLPVPSGDVYRVRFYGLIEGQMTVNVFHYMISTGGVNVGTIDQQADLLEGIIIAGGLKDKYTAAVSGDWTWEAITIDSPTTPALATQKLGVSGTGSNAPGTTPTFTAVLIHKQTMTKGKCGRGHISVPAVPVEATLASNAVDLLPWTNLSTQMSANILGTTGNFLAGLYSRGIKTQKKDGFQIYSKVYVIPLLTTVRRRKIGRGK